MTIRSSTARSTARSGGTPMVQAEGVRKRFGRL